MLSRKRPLHPLRCARLSAVKRGLKEQLINNAHQVEVHLALALRLLVERGLRDRQQGTLLANRQARQVWFNPLAPHLPVQGLSFLAKKSLATASSPILACRSLTCSSSTSGAFRPPRSNTPNKPSSRARLHRCIIVGCTPKRLASSLTVSSPFSASNATLALNSG